MGRQEASRDKSWLSRLLNPLTQLDQGILVCIFVLIGVGLVQVYSSSYIFAIENFSDGLMFFRKQLIAAVLGIGAMIFASLIPWRWVEKWGPYLWILSIGLLVLTLVPGIGVLRGGASRWISLPFGFYFESSELFKLSFVLVLAAFLARDQKALGKFKWPVRVFVIASPLVILILQPDFGSVAICVMALSVLLFMFGLRLRYILGAGLLLAPAFWYFVWHTPYRRLRILAFLDPWGDPSNTGFQVIQSMLGLHNGGFWGAGLGEGQSKLFFLPEAHTDFVLAVLGEEMGFVGVVIVLLLYGYLVFRGFQIGSSSSSKYAKAVVLGITVLFGLQVFINSGVVMGLLPAKGLTLPFLSSGGSSLIVTCLMMGLILNVQRAVPKVERIKPKGVARRLS